MRLDHLLSKEHLKVAGPSTVLDVCFAGDAHVGSICFPVGAQGWNINRQVPGVEPGSTVRSLVVLWMTVRGLEPLPVSRVPGFSVWHTVGS